MRIRNSVNNPPPPPPTPPSFSASPSAQPSPHVMVSRINPRLSTIDSKYETITDHDSCSISSNESFGHQTSTSSNSVSSSSSYNRRWCEEEKAMPLKKRRVVMVKAESRKKDDENERCTRGNGKGWRCNKVKVKGHSFCNHHLEMQRVRNNRSRNQGGGEEGGSGETTTFGVEKKRVKGVKARSINSLLRDTVPLFYY